MALCAGELNVMRKSMERKFTKLDMLLWAKFSRETECLWSHEEKRFEEWLKAEPVPEQTHCHNCGMETLQFFKIKQRVKLVNNSYEWFDISTYTVESEAWKAYDKIKSPNVVLIKIVESRIA